MFRLAIMFALLLFSGCGKDTGFRPDAECKICFDVTMVPCVRCGGWPPTEYGPGTLGAGCEACNFEGRRLCPGCGDEAARNGTWNLLIGVGVVVLVIYGFAQARQGAK